MKFAADRSGPKPRPEFCRPNSLCPGGIFIKQPYCDGGLFDWAGWLGAFEHVCGQGLGVQVFSPAEFPYHDGVWDDPLLVLVDQETWFANEEFAAVLQDNKAAVTFGTRTGGSGCGYTDGGTDDDSREQRGGT
jgi:hypothetical protein